MAGAGQWAGPLPPALLLCCHQGSPRWCVLVVLGQPRRGAALGQGLFSSGKVGAAVRGARLARGSPLQCHRSS